MDEVEQSRRGIFPPTSYSILGRIGDDDPERRREALDVLVRRYMTPLRVHLRARWNIQADRADDVLQGFLTDCLLSRDLVARYEACRGKFRTYLASAFDHFVISSVFRSSKKETVGFPMLRWEVGDLEEPAEGEGRSFEPDRFEAAWALEIAAALFGRMRRRCMEAGQERIWEVFAGRLLAPALWGEPEVPYEELARRFNYPSAKQAADALTTAKRILKAIQPGVMQHYVAESDEVPEALDDLIAILTRCGAERTRGLRILLERRTGEVVMVEDQGDSVRPDLLAQLLASEEQSRVPWGAEEKGILLRHFLASPVQFYLGELGPELSRRLRHSTRDVALPIISLGDLMREPAPDPDLLDLIKKFARAQRQDPNSALPRDIAAVVYYLCIAVASLRSGRGITKLTPAELRHALEWAIGQSWIGPDVAAVFRDLLERLDMGA